MRDALPIWWKVTAALTISVGTLIFLNSCELTHDVCLGAKALWFNARGSEADYQGLITDTQRRFAHERGLDELFERFTVRQQAIEAFRKLGQIDWQSADDTLRIVVEQRAEQTLASRPKHENYWDWLSSR